MAGINFQDEREYAPKLTPNKVETITFTVNPCDHKKFTYRKVIVNFYLFEITMVYKVCHDCHALIKTQKKWKINLK